MREDILVKGQPSPRMGYFKKGKYTMFSGKRKYGKTTVLNCIIKHESIFNKRIGVVTKNILLTNLIKEKIMLNFCMKIVVIQE